MELLDNGDGYKEQPEAFFSYGQDGNSTSDLNQTGKAVASRGDLDNITDPVHGMIRYVVDEDQVYSFHFPAQMQTPHGVRMATTMIGDPINLQSASRR